MVAKLRVFIGSSSKSAHVVDALCSALKLHEDLAVLHWAKSVEHGQSIWPRLLELARESDHGIFVLRPDEGLELGGTQLKTPRPNVLLEFGAWAASLGPEHCIGLYQEGAAIPTDLGGLKLELFDGTPEDAVRKAPGLADRIMRRGYGTQGRHVTPREAVDTAIFVMQRYYASDIFHASLNFETDPYPSAEGFDDALLHWLGDHENTRFSNVINELNTERYARAEKLLQWVGSDRLRAHRVRLWQLNQPIRADRMGNFIMCGIDPVNTLPVIQFRRSSLPGGQDTAAVTCALHVRIAYEQYSMWLQHNARRVRSLDQFAKVR